MVANVFLTISSWWMSLDINYQTLIISIIASFFIFILGFVLNGLFRRYNKSTELKQYKQFIEEWITESKKTLSKYISSLEKFSNDIECNKELNIPKWKSNIIHVSEINKIPLEKFSDIYIFGIKNKCKKENRTKLMSFLYQLEYLDKAPSLIMDLYNEYCRHNEDIMNEWNVYYLQLHDLYLKLGPIEKSSILGMSRNTHLLSEQFFSLSNINETNLNNWKTGYIDPVLQELKRDNLGNPTLFQIGVLARNLNIVIIKHNNLNRYSGVFMEYVTNLKKSQDTINDFMKYFENKNIKRLCK